MHSYCCIAVLIQGIHTKSNAIQKGYLYSEFIISSHFLSPCLGLRLLGRSPTRALDQATATQSPRCPASVYLQRQQKPREPTNQQDSNSTYSSTGIAALNSSAVLVLYTAVPSTPSQLTHHVQQYSRKAVYCSTYIFVEHQASTIGISVSETKASYRLLCLALKRRFCDHEGYETYVPSKTGALGTLKGPLPKLSCFRNVSPRKQCVSTGDVLPPLT